MYADYTGSATWEREVVSEKDSVNILCAIIRIMVKRILNKYGYPPDLQEDAVKTVLAQAELLCAEWV